MFQISQKHQRIVTPHTPALAQLVPHARQLLIGNAINLVLPHDEDHTKLLRNFNLPVPAPVLSYYNWSYGKPYQAQRETVALLTTEKRAYVLNGMGTGKTKSALWAFDWLHSRGLVRRALIVAPLSTLERTWAKEIFDTVPHHRHEILHGARERRFKRLANLDASLYVINHDGIDVMWKELISRRDIDLIIIDELAVYRAGRGPRWKTMRAVCDAKPRVWGMTGAPTPGEPTDAWGQAKLVTPNSAPMSRGSFREEVMLKVSNFRWVPKPHSTKRVHDMLQPAVRYTLDDVVELPETVMEMVDVAVGTKQAQVYAGMERHTKAMIENGELTAANAGVAFNKLLQISMGWVYRNDGTTLALDNEDRLMTLLDKIESSDRKVIIFVPYIHALQGVSDFLTLHGAKNRVVSGSVSKTQRDQIFQEFQNGGDWDALVAHPACMAHGLTLTAADTIIWFGPFPSLEVFDQANARITRIGQQHKQYVIMLAGTKVERQLYNRLRKKQQVQNLLLDMIREETAQNEGRYG